MFVILIQVKDMSVSGRDDKNVGKEARGAAVVSKQVNGSLAKTVQINDSLLNTWIKEWKTCYSSWKETAYSWTENQYVKEIQRKRKEFNKELCDPLANLYRQLPLDITNFKFELIQQYPQQQRLFLLQGVTLFTAITTIGSSKLSGANKLLFSFRNSGVMFVLGGLLVVPEIYNPWIKNDC